LLTYHYLSIIMSLLPLTSNLNRPTRQGNIAPTDHRHPAKHHIIKNNRKAKKDKIKNSCYKTKKKNNSKIKKHTKIK
ncbi:hypothetical protein NQU36_28510, partial [Escherichia coli]|uniref:hypothetical protein n=1 Tax=Escherichia coli TaxID=562 RepID=UPI00211838A2